MISQMDNNDNEENQVKMAHSDFSIEHILNRAGSSSFSQSGNFQNCDESGGNSYHLDPYSWLQCTRYCPPKVPRLQRKQGPQKRQLGRHPRIPFTSHQLSVLEEKFQESPYLSSEEVINLSRKLQLADIRVKIWFQNRRARERREKCCSTSVKITNEEVLELPVANQSSPSNSSSISPVNTIYSLPNNSFLLNIEQSTSSIPPIVLNYFTSVPQKNEENAYK